MDLAVEAPPDSAAAPGPFPAIVAEDSVVAVDSTATAAVEGSTAADSAVEAASMVVVAATAAAVDTGNCIAKSKGPSSRRAFLLFYPSHSATLDDSSCQSSRQLCLDPKPL